MEYDAFIGLIEKLSLLSIILISFSKGYGLIELAYIYVISSVISLILSIIIIFKKISKIQFFFDISLCRGLIIESIPFGLNALFGILFFRIDTIMLSALKNDTQVGIYNAAYNPLLALGVVPSVFVAAIYPVMSRTFMSSKNSLDIITKLSSKYMALLGFPMAIGCIILADKFIKLLYADQFSSSIVAFQILAFFIPLRWISSITGTFLTSTNRQSFRTLSVGLSAILNIILNAIMIPHFGYIGASVSTVLSEIFLYFIIIFYINKSHRNFQIHRSFIKPLAASLFMGVFVYLLKDTNLFLLITLAAIIYFAILLLIKTFNKDDLYILKLVFKRC
jgi:O-antigen/teichoic acid export membrane protein